MSINWVMLPQNATGLGKMTGSRSPKDLFVPLAEETVITMAPFRTSFKLRPLNDGASSSTGGSSDASTYPGNRQFATQSAAPSILPSRPTRLDASLGHLILTSHRLLYLPDSSAMSTTKNFVSFSVPLKQVHDSHVEQPWFGPNAWTCVITPVPEGGLPPHNAFEVTCTFKDGGAYDFHSKYENLRERMQDGINHIDELPLYQEAPSATPLTSASTISHTADAIPPSFGTSGNSTGYSVPSRDSNNEDLPPPYEAI
ncbi:hypothetical protein V1511DRAFT_504189 [Dipodascopsis uninucleata]